MESVSSTVRQDVEAAARAFEQDDFENMNIFANRVMADAIFGADGKLALPGFFLKHLSFVYGNLKTRGGAPFSTAKSIGEAYISSLSKLISSTDFGGEGLWQEFHEFNDGIRKFLINEFEEKTYKDNPSFTHHAIKWLLRYLSERKELLLDPNNMFLKGLLNEMDRIFRVHGGELSDTYAISLVTGLDRYYDYFRLAYRTPDGAVDEGKAKGALFPYVDRIVKLLSSDAEVNVLEVNDVLWGLIKGWREFFIHYMERPRPGYAVERGIELPEEAKKRLTETITKALEKEVRMK